MPRESGRPTLRERAAAQTSPVTRRSRQRDEDPNNSARKQNAADTGDANAFKGRRLDLDGEEQSSSRRVPTVAAPTGEKADTLALGWPALRDKVHEFDEQVDAAGTRWYRVRARSSRHTWCDRYNRHALFQPSQDEAVRQAQTIYLTKCAESVFADCDVAKGLHGDVQVRWLRVKPPRRRTGLTAALFEGPDGAVRRLPDGGLASAATNLRTSPERLERYVSKMGDDKGHVAAFVEYVGRESPDDVRTARWVREKDRMEIIRAKSAAKANMRFDELRAKLREKEADVAKALLGDGTLVLPYRPESQGEISWLGHPNHFAREVLAAWRASDRGAANRGALTNARKSEIRRELEATGMLDEFVRLKFPSLVPSFDEDPELLQLFVDAVHVDHIVSSGCDFDENLWLEMDRINIWFGENRAMPLKRERVGDPVWARAVAVFNRLVRKEAGVFRL